MEFPWYFQIFQRYCEERYLRRWKFKNTIFTFQSSLSNLQESIINTTLHWQKATARKLIENQIMHQRFLWYFRIPTHYLPHNIIPQKELIYISSQSFIILIITSSIKFILQLRSHSLITYTSLERGWERVTLYEFLWGWWKGYLPVHTHYTCINCFYKIEMFWCNLNSLQLSLRLTTKLQIIFEDQSDIMSRRNKILPDIYENLSGINF